MKPVSEVSRVVWLMAAGLLAAGVEIPFPCPSGEVAAAVEDLSRRVPASLWTDTRYVSLYHLPSQQRAMGQAALSFVLNTVSRADQLVLPEGVPGTGNRLLRISLAAYGLPGEAWEALASGDPYWHIRTQVSDPSLHGKGTAPPGSRTASESSSRQPVREVYTDGGWVGLQQAGRLRQMTRSGGAVLRIDYCLARATSTQNGGVYYQLAGVPERERDFFQQLGLDLPAINDLRADEGANLIHSGITRKVRRVVRRQGPLGGAWQTYDVARSTPERDPLRNPFAFQYDAGEHIAAKRNGLHLYALYDRNGRRQDSVPDSIAKDSSDPAADGIVRPMLSCVRCHVEDGLRPFVNDQRGLLSGGIELLTQRPQDAQRLAAFYDSNLEKKLQRDREDYAEAVAAATGGLSPAVVAGGLATLVGEYRDRLVSIDRAAREIGATKEDVQRALQSSNDPVLLALSQGMAVDRDQWESSFAEAALLITAHRGRSTRQD